MTAAVSTSSRWHLIVPVAIGACGALGFPLVIESAGSEPILDGWLPRELFLFVAAFWLYRLTQTGLSTGRQMRRAFGAGLGFFLVLLYWLDIAMRRYGGLPLWQAMPALLLLASYCALYWALLPPLCRLLRSLPMPGPAAFAFAVIIAEWLRTVLMTGFPWGLWGYSQTRNTPLAQLASLAGVYGLSWLIALWAAGLGELFGKWRQRAPLRPAWLWLIASVTTAHAIGWAILAGRPPDEELGRRVAIIQGNVEQRIKNRDEAYRDSILETYLELSASAEADGAELLVWPEAAWPGHLPADSQTLPRRVSHLPMLIGASTIQIDAELVRARNSALWLDRRRVLARYDKRHLVPFGEYVPLRQFLPAERLVPGSIDYLPGESDQPIGEPPTGVLICYDGIFPRLSRQSVRAGATMLANLTNDGWYGISSAAYQHHDFYRLRAIETDRWVIRAANTGISSFIGPDGRLHAATELGTRTVTATQVWPRRTATPYVLLGDWLVALALGFALAAGLETLSRGAKHWRQRRKRGVDNQPVTEPKGSIEAEPPAGGFH